MTNNLSFDAEQRRLQGAWFTENLAPNQGYAGAAYRTPPASRILNLAPAIRNAADRLFAAEPPIQWHQHANHGLSSQVCCITFLLPFAAKPELLRRWVEHVTGDRVAEMLPIESDRAAQQWFVTFEWIGDTDYLNEGKEGAPRKRRANATAADAAVLFRDVQDRTQLLLIEWKYTERYGQPLDPKGNATRRQRYQDIFRHPNGPIRADADVTLDDFFYEPFYQMLRQQMLAWRTESEQFTGRPRTRSPPVAVAQSGATPGNFAQDVPVRRRCLRRVRFLAEQPAGLRLHVDRGRLRSLGRMAGSGPVPVAAESLFVVVGGNRGSRLMARSPKSSKCRRAEA